MQLGATKLVGPERNLQIFGIKVLEDKCSTGSADLAPRVFLSLTDNWVELTVRFLCQDHDIRALKDRMSCTIKARLDAANIGIASSTYDIAGMPPIQVEMTSPRPEHR